MENRFLSLHTLFLDKSLKETNLCSKHVVLKEKILTRVTKRLTALSQTGTETLEDVIAGRCR